MNLSLPIFHQAAAKFMLARSFLERVGRRTTYATHFHLFCCRLFSAAINLTQATAPISICTCTSTYSSLFCLCISPPQQPPVAVLHSVPLIKNTTCCCRLFSPDYLLLFFFLHAFIIPLLFLLISISLWPSCLLSRTSMCLRVCTSAHVS